MLVMGRVLYLVYTMAQKKLYIIIIILRFLKVLGASSLHGVGMTHVA